MKIESPYEFIEWLSKYCKTANYFMAEREFDADQKHALFLCLRDAFIEGIKTGSKPVEGK